MGWLFKQSLAVDEQNSILSYFEFSWILYLSIYYNCKQCQEGQRLAVEGHLFNYNNSLVKIT